MSRRSEEKRRRNWGSRLAIGAALVGGLVLGTATSAAAATVYTVWTPWGSPQYTTRGYITDASIYGGNVKRADGASSTAGQLGVYATIWRGTTHCGTTSILYNSYSLVQLTSSTTARTSGYCSAAANFTARSTGGYYVSSTGAYSWKVTVASPAKGLPAR